MVVDVDEFRSRRLKAIQDGDAIDLEEYRQKKLQRFAEAPVPNFYPSINPTEAQARAIRDAKAWFLTPFREQVFRIYGYAGTGKTTIVKYLIGELGLSIDGLLPDVRFMTFTGKAAYVMRKHGVPARTCHSLLYTIMQMSDEEIDNMEKRVIELQALCPNVPGEDRLHCLAEIERMKKRIRLGKRPSWDLDTESVLCECKLIVIDEGSMIDEEMAAHILSFDKPVILLGDPGQLPPIKGEGALTDAEPNIMLTEIHRQALESPIIRLATMAREGQQIPYGAYSDAVWKMRKADVSPQMLLMAQQVICGRNQTRLNLNNALRTAAGFGGAVIPTGPAEKVICLRNDWRRGLINGMFVSIEPRSDPVVTEHDSYFRGVVHTEEGKLVAGASDMVDKDGKPLAPIYYGHFEDHVRYEKDRNDRDWKKKRGLIEATFGWAITCHKSQGSQWENIVVWDDHLFGHRHDQSKRWLYTAITRAENGLLICD